MHERDGNGPVGTEARRCLEEAAKALTYSCILGILTASVSEGGEADLLSGLPGEEQRRLMRSILSSIGESGMGGYLDFMAGAGPEAGARRRAALAYMAKRDVDTFFAAEPPIPGLPLVLQDLLFPVHEREEMLKELKAHHPFLAPLSAFPGTIDERLVGPATVHVLPVLERLFALFLSGWSHCDHGTRAAIGEGLARAAEDWVRALPHPSPLLASLRSLV